MAEMEDLPSKRKSSGPQVQTRYIGWYTSPFAYHMLKDCQLSATHADELPEDPSSFVMLSLC